MNFNPFRTVHELKPQVLKKLQKPPNGCLTGTKARFMFQRLHEKGWSPTAPLADPTLSHGLQWAGWRGGGVATQRPAKPCTPVRFRSAPPSPSLGRRLIRRSSVVEQSTVNRSVVSSNLTAGANTKGQLSFLYGRLAFFRLCMWDAVCPHTLLFGITTG